MSENHNKIFNVTDEWSKIGLVNKKSYEEKYNESINDNDAFWAKEGKAY